jgi:hypothetical protein
MDEEGGVKLEANLKCAQIITLDTPQLLLHASIPNNYLRTCRFFIDNLPKKYSTMKQSRMMIMVKIRELLKWNNKLPPKKEWRAQLQRLFGHGADDYVLEILDKNFSISSPPAAMARRPSMGANRNNSNINKEQERARNYGEIKERKKVIKNNFVSWVFRDSFSWSFVLSRAALVWQ